MSDREINFGKTILAGRSHRDLTDDEVLARARDLLEGWLGGELRMERPKLYDHYALLLVALVRRVQDLEARVATLEGGRAATGENGEGPLSRS